MATAVLESAATVETPTLQDLVDRLGGIPLSRILAKPAPGTATEADLIQVNDGNRRLCELVDGALVEKAMGLRESLLALVIRRCSESSSSLAIWAWSQELMERSGCSPAWSAFPMSPSSHGAGFRKDGYPKLPFLSSHPTWPSRFSVRVIPRPRCGGSGGITSRRELTLSGRSIPKSEPWRSTSEVKINRGSMIARRRSRAQYSLTGFQLVLPNLFQSWTGRQERRNDDQEVNG